MSDERCGALRKAQHVADTGMGGGVRSRSGSHGGARRDLRQTYGLWPGRTGGTVTETVVITGAFSYTGRYATRILLERGYRVRTLTGHPERASEFGELVAAFPYNLENPEELRKNLAGASTLINTYWVRFPRRGVTFETAVRNSRILINAAREAGVRRIVHVSI